MSIGKVGRSLAALTLIGLTFAGCTADPAPAPSPTPIPPASQTPTESPQQRQERLDYEAAEKAYRTFRAEYRRVLRDGGAKQATAVMKETAGGPYLATLVEVIVGYDKLNARQKGTELIGYVRRGGYSTSSIVLDVCEDDRPVDALLKDGKKYGRGEVRTARLDLQKKDGRWKVWEGTGTKVESCT